MLQEPLMPPEAKTDVWERWVWLGLSGWGRLADGEDAGEGLVDEVDERSSTDIFSATVG